MMTSEFSSDQAPSTPDQERLTWQQTRALMRSDFERLVEWYGGGSFSRRLFWFFQPNYHALFCYRIYRYLYLKNFRSLSRLLFLYTLYRTGVEISPTTSLGPACLIGHAFGVILFGKIGARFSVHGQGGMGGGFGEKDIGGGPGYPVVGDDVVFGIKALALGPVRIGNRVKLAPTAVVLGDVPDDALVMAAPSKIVKARMGLSDTGPGPAGPGPAGPGPAGQQP
jgi:serine acetyltransferase